MAANCAPDSLVNLLSYSRKTNKKRRSPINELIHHGVKFDSLFPGQKHTTKVVDLIDYCSNSYNDNDNNNNKIKKKKKKRNNVQFELSKTKIHSIPRIDINDSNEYWLSDVEYAKIRESIHDTLRVHRRKMNDLQNDVVQHNEDIQNESNNEVCLRGIEHLVTVPFAKSWNRRRLLYRQMTIVKYRMDKITSTSESPICTAGTVNLFSQQDTNFVSNQTLGGEPSGISTTPSAVGQMNISSCDAERARQFGLLDETDARVIHST